MLATIRSSLKDSGRKRKGCGELRWHMSEETSFTAFGRIACSGDKLPLWVVAKGRATRTEAKFGPHPGIIMKHTESGWATENLTVEYLQGLHTEIADRRPYVLILDVYPTHRTDAVVAAAEECHVKRRFVTAGGTSEYQPLDYRIFGELKSRARAEIARLVSPGGGGDIEHGQSVTILERRWNAIQEENIQKAWGLPGLVQSPMRQ
jgi:hypothetical protein